MKNNIERAAFLADPDNWDLVEKTDHVRLSRIVYKNEKRYKLEVYEVISRFDYEATKPYESPEWFLKSYYKENDKSTALEQQSLTQLREWVADLDRKERKV